MRIARGVLLLAGAAILCACRGYERPRIDAGDPWLLGEVPAGTSAAEVTFAAVGDAGKANLPQAVVAQSVRRLCEGRCDFAVLLGDNVYESGIAGPEDEAKLRCMVESYGVPKVYLALGNHDYGPVEPTLERARNELAWIDREGPQLAGTKAYGNRHFYRFEAGPVRMVVLDTNLLVRGQLEEDDYLTLAKWLGPLKDPNKPWTFALGHHPYVSNGSHRSAGDFHDAGLSLWPGRLYRRFMAQHVVGRADLYLAGHDHTLQFIPELEGGATAELVSGAGSRCDRPPAERPQAAAMERFGYGFAIVSATRETVEVTFHDAWGESLWRTERRRDGGWAFDAPSRDGVDRCAAERERIDASGLATCSGGQ